MSGKYLGALFIGNAAIRKAGNIEGWKPYLYEKIQGGILIRGCMTAPKKRGPDKGGTKYLIHQQNLQSVVTPDDTQVKENCVALVERNYTALRPGGQHLSRIVS